VPLYDVAHRALGRTTDSSQRRALAGGGAAARINHAPASAKMPAAVVLGGRLRRDTLERPWRAACARRLRALAFDAAWTASPDAASALPVAETRALDCGALSYRPARASPATSYSRPSPSWTSRTKTSARREVGAWWPPGSRSVTRARLTWAHGRIGSYWTYRQIASSKGDCWF